MGSIEGSKNLPWLFTAVFITTLIAVPLYSHLVAKFRRRQLVPVVYRFLALNLVAFSLAMRFLDEEALKYVARVFFVWVTVYVLFSTSLFWSVQADVFSRERGKKLFGAIAGFGTVGAITSSFVVGRTAEFFGPANLLLLSAGLLEVGLWCFRHLDPSRIGSTKTEKKNPNPLDGFIQVVQSPYLRSIMLYVFSTTACGTYLYITQADMISEAYPDKAARTAIFANLDFATQTVTVVFQFVVATLLMRYSLKATLCVLPCVYLIGISGLLATPALWVLMATMVLSRASTYGLTVPATGVLYTVVSRDEKYKAKSVIDTLVIRGSDVTTNWAITGLRSIGLVFSALSGMMVVIASVGLGLAVLLGYRNAQLKDTPSAEEQQ